MTIRGGVAALQHHDLVPPIPQLQRHHVSSSSVRMRRRREGEAKKKRERHSGDFSYWRTGGGVGGRRGGEGGGGGGLDEGEGWGEGKVQSWSKRLEEEKRIGKSRRCSGEFTFKRTTEERTKKNSAEEQSNIFNKVADDLNKQILFEEQATSCHPTVRRGDKTSAKWRTSLSERIETDVQAPLSLQKSAKKDKLLKLRRNMTMLEEGGRNSGKFWDRMLEKETSAEETMLSLTSGSRRVQEVAGTNKCCVFWKIKIFCNLFQEMPDSTDKRKGSSMVSCTSHDVQGDPQILRMRVRQDIICILALYLFASDCTI